MKKIGLLSVSFMAISLLIGCNNQMEKYRINYLNLNGSTTTNPVSYTSNDAFSLLDPSDHGYAFMGWRINDEHGEEIKEISKGSKGDLNLYATWGKVNTYKITYEELKGAKTDNKTTYTVETPTFELTNPSENGYTFTGWYLDNSKITQIKKGTFGDLTISAGWGVKKTYFIKYNLPKGTAPKSKTYTIDNLPIKLENPTNIPNGYRFDGWFTDAEYKNKITIIDKDNIGVQKLYGKVATIEYKITYNNLLPGVTAPDPKTFNVETPTFALKPPGGDAGYKFDGWLLDGFKITQIKRGSITEDIALDAAWGELKQYKIAYPNVPIIATNINPKLYTIESSFELQAPTNTGYTEFKGWHLNSPTGEVIHKIDKGSKGDIALYAEWGEPIAYKINYVTRGGSFKEDPPRTYTVDRNLYFPPVELIDFDFTGWYYDAYKESPIKNNSIKAGERVGDITVYAGWKSKMTLSAFSWEKISEISQNGEASKYFNIGDEKEVLMTKNKISHRVRIIGFHHDELATSTAQKPLYAGITFEFANLITTKDDKGAYQLYSVYWNEFAKGNNRDFPTSNLNGFASSIYDNEIKDELLDSIKKVKKNAKIDGDFFSRPYETHLFPLAVGEMLEDDLSAPIAEGKQYAYYKLGGSPYKYMVDASETTPYWLRSADTQTSNSAYAYDYNRLFNSIYVWNTTHDRGIAPGFCI